MTFLIPSEESKHYLIITCQTTRQQKNPFPSHRWVAHEEAAPVARCDSSHSWSALLPRQGLRPKNHEIAASVLSFPDIFLSLLRKGTCWIRECSFNSWGGCEAKGEGLQKCTVPAPVVCWHLVICKLYLTDLLSVPLLAFLSRWSRYKASYFLQKHSVICCPSLCSRLKQTAAANFTVGF